MEYEGADWIQLAQIRIQLRALVNAVKHFRVPFTTGNVFMR
jgi:hypothetical protein